MNQGHTPDEGEKALTGVLDVMKQQPVDPKAPEKAKNQEISGYISGRETEQRKAVALALATVMARIPISSMWSLTGI